MSEYQNPPVEPDSGSVPPVPPPPATGFETVPAPEWAQQAAPVPPAAAPMPPAPMASGPIPPVPPASGPVPPAGYPQAGYPAQGQFAQQPYQYHKASGGFMDKLSDSKTWPKMLRLAGMLVAGSYALFGLIGFFLTFIDSYLTGYLVYSAFTSLLKTLAISFFYLMIAFGVAKIGEDAAKEK